MGPNMNGSECISDLLSVFSQLDKDSAKEIDIEFNRRFNAFKHKADQMGMLGHCRLCGARLTGRANSHSVPRMILQNVEADGELIQPTAVIDQGIKLGPFGRSNRFGLNNAGTFHLICHACDKNYFADYEMPEYWEWVAKEGSRVLSDKILAEIYLKSALRERYKKEFGKNFDALINAFFAQNGDPRHIITTSDELSVREDDALIDKCQKIIDENKPDQFEVFYFDVLDHSSNIAAQALLAIHKTPTNEIINRVFNLDPNYRIVLTEMVVFPLKDKTICFCYCLKQDVSRLLPFIRYMQGLSQTAQRKLFQATLFAFTEEVYASQEVVDEIANDPVSTGFINAALKSAHISPSREDKAYDDLLTSTRNFRKAKLHI